MYEENFDLNTELSMEHIGMDHIIEHEEVVEQFQCHRKDIADRSAYNKALLKYNKELEEYHNKNWFIRLFLKKPIEPQLHNFISY